MSTPLLARHLRFDFPGRPLLQDISLDLRPGRVTALLGPNGSGKSTLLRLLLGLLEPKAGEVCLNGRNIRTMRRPEVAALIAFVPQQTASAFAYTALEIVLMARESRRSFLAGRRAGDRQIAMAALAQLGATGLADRTFSLLSGGERQLVLLARALAQESPILILDEPATGLDYGNQIRMLDLITELARSLNKAILQTTHAPEHALASADDILLLKEGRILQRGSPHEVLTSEMLAALYDLPVEKFERHQRNASILSEHECFPGLGS
ncbi:iron complex transport system ATP-binding protein [Terrimicrobium sacchariphilum]|uniref:Iron complex transport system ATP-binding protein n=1 Tax=Terrimicrobium sacchariphilum TaxID=690879 RepID=A0A146G8E5_TERSA|nr:ABC transporter ATP-binding protein [Terrimicrobium sacchariphilum]GAT33975.1 iron complex transport system ATP-binding protein [Terrimicrobium sacchariphilum]